MTTVIQFPVIAGVEISTDDQGRFNLNALHRASGLGSSKSPSQWLRTKQAEALAQALVDQNAYSHSGEVIRVVNGGATPGTFAHEILAVEYAGWISPAFRIQVNQTFIDYKTGKLGRPIEALSKLDILRMAMESEEQRIALEHQNRELSHQIEESAPKVQFYEAVTSAQDEITVRDAAKLLGTGQNRMFKFLRREGWINRYNEPYQRRIDAGHMDVKIHQFEHPDHGLKKSLTPLITAKGLARLQQIWHERSPEAYKSAAAGVGAH